MPVMRIVRAEITSEPPCISDCRLPICDCRNSVGVGLFCLNASQTRKSSILNLNSKINSFGLLGDELEEDGFDVAGTDSFDDEFEVF